MKNIPPRHDATGMRIAIVRARFNEEIGEEATKQCILQLRHFGVAEEDITVLTVPGSLEAPMVLQSLAHSARYDALIALGAVIRGETYHFEIVSNEMAAGIMRVQLETGVPIANGILTVENDEQARARAGRKGRECAEVAVELANLLNDIAERDE